MREEVLCDDKRHETQEGTSGVNKAEARALNIDARNFGETSISCQRKKNEGLECKNVVVRSLLYQFK